MKRGMESKIRRVIDANFNRSREGLRVCEDICRFVLNSSSLAQDLKDARHTISGIIRSSRGYGTPYAFTRARDPEGDVARCSSRPSEMERRDFADLFLANIERVKESVRVLEEFFKLVDKKSSIKFSRLRFKIYAIEKRALDRIRKRAG